MKTRVNALKIAIIILFLASNSVLAQQKTKVTSEEKNGLTTVTFETNKGNVSVFLPSNVHAGDIISGTVIAEPKGKNEKQIAKNKNVLNGYVYELENQQAPVSKDKQTWELPEVVEDITKLILKDPKGNILASAGIPVTNTPRTAFIPKVLKHSDFDIPTYVRAGELEKILGWYDGDFSNSAINIDGKPIEILAESPTGIFFEVPENITGPAEFSFSENGFESSEQINVLDLELTADKMTLAKGEKTNIHITVTGLEEFDNEVPIEITNLTPGNIEINGGNKQEKIITPEEISMEGKFKYDKEVVAIGTGGFSVLVKVEQPDYKKIKLATPADGSVVDLSSLNFSWLDTNFPANTEYTFKIFPLDDNLEYIPSTKDLMEEDPLLIVENLDKSNFELTEEEIIDVNQFEGYLWLIEAYDGMSGELLGEGGPGVFYSISDTPECTCGRGYRGRIYADILNAANVIIGHVELGPNPYTVQLPAEALSLRFQRYELDCGNCLHAECLVNNVVYNPAIPRFTPNATTQTLNVDVNWTCSSPGCEDKNCHYTYKLKYKIAPDKCTCGDVQVTATITNIDSDNNAFQGTSTVITKHSHAKSTGQQIIRPRGNLRFEDGDILEIRLSGILARCWCMNGPCNTTATNSDDIRGSRSVTFDFGENDPEASNDNHNMYRVQNPRNGWQANGDYIIHVAVKNAHTLVHNIYQDFLIKWNCEKEDCYNTYCDKNFRLLFGSF